MEEVKILNITSQLSIDVVRKDIKNVHLAVYPPTGRVRIASPLRINDEAVRLFAISKIAWIRKHQRNFLAQDRQLPRQFKDRESHYFQGKRYLLRITELDAPPKVVLTTKKYIDLFVRPNTDKKQRQIILNEWYRKQLKSQVSTLINKWEKIIGVHINGWSVKKMKTSWGTCNTQKKHICVNLELAKKPLEHLEYIVVHEIIHLLERHHNAKFMSYLNRFMPQWEYHKKELGILPIS